MEYDEKFDEQKFPVDTFIVPERNITKIYTASHIEFENKSSAGNFIIIELDPHDEKSSTLIDMHGQHVSVPKQPFKPSGNTDSKKAFKGKQEVVLPDGRVLLGPVGQYCVRNKIEVPIRQAKALISADGREVEPFEEYIVSDREINEWSDLFEVRTFEDINYNIYIPEDYDPAVSYPLVLFIHDAGTCGENPRVTLEQGIGATVFASPAEQMKHKCIVVAPQHSKYYPIANDNYWCLEDEHTIKRLLDAVQEQYSVDPDRIYTTGQSMGFMTSIQLILDYPGYFAAALLPAGHWDIEKTASLWQENIWMFLSEPDRGAKKLIDNLPTAIEEAGGKVGVYVWDADQPTEEIGRLITNVKDDGNSFHITVFPGESIYRPHQSDRTEGGAHPCTWQFVYQIEAARDWLFEQRRRH